MYWPPPLKKKFRLLVFDWDGTAVESRSAPVDELRWRVEDLLRCEVKHVIVTGTHFGNPNRQFCRWVQPELKRHLYVAPNRGSEVYGFDAQGEPLVLHRRVATDAENRLMDELSEEMKEWLETAHGLEVEIVSDRFNRRKLDLYPPWQDPPKEQIDELLETVQAHLRAHGLGGGLQEVINRVEEWIAQHRADLRLTTDVKHIEYGLTDKSDSVAFVLHELAPQQGISVQEILFLGDEFGPIGGFEGSDFKMFIPAAQGATYVSVGKEPNGVPEGVLHLGGGPAMFRAILDEQRRYYGLRGQK